MEQAESEVPVDVTEVKLLRHEITARNADSRLLRLPQELKNQIYELVLGGRLIHAGKDDSGGRVYHGCRAKISEKEAHEIFAMSKEQWSPKGILNRHFECYHGGTEGQCYDWLDREAKSSCALLYCCRQIHQEASPTIVSTNMVSYAHSYAFLPSDEDRYEMVERKSATRRLHLDLHICDDEDESYWNEAFYHISHDFKSLQHIHIDICQAHIEDDCVRKWQFKKPVESSFLGDVRKLRALSLKTVTITVSDDPVWYFLSYTAFTAMPHRWKMAQKQEWAAYIRRVLLRQEDQEPAAEAAT